MPFGQDRQMFDVDLACAKCGAHISQLPFQPSGDRKVYCAECNRAFRQSRDGGMGGRTGGFNSRPRAPRQMFSVNLACADCGKEITELPFQPSGDKPVYCTDCLRNRRNAA